MFFNHEICVDCVGFLWHIGDSLIGDLDQVLTEAGIVDTWDVHRQDR